MKSSTTKKKLANISESAKLMNLANKEPEASFKQKKLTCVI